MSQKESDQFASFFGVVGAIAGFCYGAVVSDGNGLFALFLAIVGGGTGAFVGKIVYRLFLLGLLIVGFLIRQQIFEAIGSIFE